MTIYLVLTQSSTCENMFSFCPSYIRIFIYLPFPPGRHVSFHNTSHTSVTDTKFRDTQSRDTRLDSLSLSKFRYISKCNDHYYLFVFKQKLTNRTYLKVQLVFPYPSAISILEMIFFKLAKVHINWYAFVASSSSYEYIRILLCSVRPVLWPVGINSHGGPQAVLTSGECSKSTFLEQNCQIERRRE